MKILNKMIHRLVGFFCSCSEGGGGGSGSGGDTPSSSNQSFCALKDTTDNNLGTSRTQGSAYDIGVYEYPFETMMGATLKKVSFEGAL